MEIRLFKPKGAVFFYRKRARWLTPAGMHFYHTGRTGAKARMLFSRLNEHQRAACVEAWHRGYAYSFHLPECTPTKDNRNDQ